MAVPYRFLENFYALCGVQPGQITSLAGTRIQHDGLDVLTVEEGRSFSEDEYNSLPYETVLCRGVVRVQVLQGDTVVRFRQAHKVKFLKSQYLKYGFLKTELVKLSLRDPKGENPQIKRGYWCFGTVRCIVLPSDVVD